MFEAYIAHTKAVPLPKDFLIHPKNPSLVRKVIVSSAVIRQIGSTQNRGARRKKRRASAGYEFKIGSLPNGPPL